MMERIGLTRKQKRNALSDSVLYAEKSNIFYVSISNRLADGSKYRFAWNLLNST